MAAHDSDSALGALGTALGALGAALGTAALARGGKPGQQGPAGPTGAVGPMGPTGKSAGVAAVVAVSAPGSIHVPDQFATWNITSVLDVTSGADATADFASTVGPLLPAEIAQLTNTVAAPGDRVVVSMQSP